MLFGAVGAGIALGLGRLVPSSTFGGGSRSEASPPVSGSASLKVKVTYFQMPLLVGGTSLAEEYFTLPSPAYLRDLLSSVQEAHPPFGAMLPTMTILVDGTASPPSTPLKDGDEVDFIPAYAGG